MPRNNRNGWLACIVSLILSGCSIPELELRITDYERLIDEKQFQELESIEKDLQKSNITDGQGNTELQLFYKAVSRRFENDGEWMAHRKIIEEWVNNSNLSEASLLALAFHYYQYGWWHRGSAYASKTRQENLQNYAENLAKVRAALIPLATSSQKNPAYWELVLWLAITEGWSPNQFETAYLAATGLRPDYLVYHLIKTRYYQPKWHGSREKYQQVVEEIVSTYSPYFGDRIYGRIQSSDMTGKMFEDGQADWVRTKQSFYSITAKYPVRMNYFHFARLSCLAEDWEVAQENISKLDPKPSVKEWSTANYKYCVSAGKYYLPGQTVAELKKVDASSTFTRFISPPKKGLEYIPQNSEATRNRDHSMDALDAELVASLRGDDTEYNKIRRTLYEIALRNPNVVRLIDEYEISIVNEDFVEVLVRIARIDVDEALMYLSRIPSTQRRVIERIKEEKRLEKGPLYHSWLMTKPMLWQADDLQNITLPPQQILDTIETLKNRQVSRLRDRAVDEFLTDHTDLVMNHVSTLHGTVQHHIRSNLKRQLLRQGNEEAIRFVRKYDDAKGSQFKSVMRGLAYDGIDPIELTDRIGVTLSESELHSAIRSWAYNNPKSAATYLYRVPNDSSQIINGVARYYRRKLKDEYLVWLQANAEWTTVKDIRSLVKTDHELATSIVSLISDQKRRERLERELGG